MRLVNDPKIELLRRQPLLAGASKSELQAIASAGDIVTVEHHQRFMREGERAEEVFFLLEGMVQVAVDGVTVAYLEDGDVVGELGLLDRSRRNATVTAVLDTTVLVIDRRHLLPLLERSPKLAKRLETVAAPRRAA